ncbi:MAG TPA: GAF domain-containing protein, partial [Microlunatus sp.]|nr:GAF domain-containing protein [Microlunatus sp.]
MRSVDRHHRGSRPLRGQRRRGAERPEVRARKIGLHEFPDPAVDPAADLSSLCWAAVQYLPVDGAAVSIMAGADHTELVHATDAIAEHLGELQFTLGEGPGRDAYRHGEPVVVTDLDQEPS